jgi:F1F0 ATPase subunit 2
MMTQILIGLAAGLLLGAAYFGGLWWTVTRVVEDGKAWKLLASFVARGALLLVGFFAVLQVGLTALGAALVAFLGVRIATTRKMRPSAPTT